MKLSVLASLILFLAFCGCTNSRFYQAKLRMDQSEAAYRNCLQINPHDPTKCETERQLWAIDVERYRVVMGLP